MDWRGRLLILGGVDNRRGGPYGNHRTRHITPTFAALVALFALVIAVAAIFPALVAAVGHHRACRESTAPIPAIMAALPGAAVVPVMAPGVAVLNRQQHTATDKDQ